MVGPPGGYSARMNTDTPTLDDLINQLRLNASTDVQFDQRVALVCCHLIATKVDPVGAIRRMFQVDGRPFER